MSYRIKYAHLKNLNKKSLFQHYDSFFYPLKIHHLKYIINIKSILKL